MTENKRQILVLDLCEEALEITASERSAWLKQQCGPDEALCNEVLVLLDQIRQEADGPLAIGLQASVKTGDHVGPYELVDTLGHGGMGTVFRARRVDAPFEQFVALKVLRAEIVTQALRQRFDLERRVLARLSHPFIASLVDGGTTAQGMPWLVMELVNGMPIDRYCNEHRLNVHDRLALLEKVAMAVQHAHQNLVIHRDLKPSNVLVTNEGMPKLVDFGIAKLIELPDVGSTDCKTDGVTTMFGQRALTPDFASPEQILDGSVSTASDIYSLGVLTMLVLTGRKPYELDTKTPRSLLESFDRKAVPRASELIVRHTDQQGLHALALERRTSPSRLRRLFQGDADAIMATALHGEPAKRYASADAFRSDLYCYRTGRPIVARGDSMLSRTVSLVRTHKLMFSVVAATVGALAVGLSLALWQARIAEQRFADLHDFSGVVLGEIYDSVADLPGSTDARKEITIAAQRYLNRLAGSDPSLARRRLHDDDLLEDLALAYKRLADVQGAPTNANLGESTLALQNYRRALVIAEQVRNESVAAKSTRGQIHNRLADVLSWQGELDEALRELKTARELFAENLAAEPDSAYARLRMAYSYVKIGDISGHPSFMNLGDTRAAMVEYGKGLALFSDADVDSEDRELLRSYGVLMERAGTMAIVEGDTDGALIWYTRSGKLRSDLAAAHADHTDIRRDAGVAIEKIADVLKTQGRLPEALEKYREALLVYRGLAEVDAANAGAKRTLAIGLENLGEALALANDNARAAERYREALVIREILVRRDPDSERLRDELEATRRVLQSL